MNAPRETPRHTPVKIIVAILLCISCIPVQALTCVREAWAAGWVAAYYVSKDHDGYTLVVQNNADPDPQYGNLVAISDIIASAERGAQAIGDAELNRKVTRVTFRDAYTATEMGNWFCGLENLREVDFSNLVPPKQFVSWSKENIRFDEMFKDCSSLEHFAWNIQLFNPEYGVESQYKKYVSFTSMFKNCVSLKTVKISGSIALKNSYSTIHINGMFQNCKNLQSVELPGFGPVAGTSVSASGAFINCLRLKEVELIGRGFSLGRTFENCISLESISIANVALPSVENFYTNCLGCANLRRVKSQTDLRLYLPRVNSFDLPGATGYWTKSGDWLVPEVVQNDIQAEWVKPLPNLYATGQPITPILEISNNGEKLISDIDYTVTYLNNITPGTATAIIKGRGTYTGQIEKSFVISAPVGSGSTTGSPSYSKPSASTGNNGSNDNSNANSSSIGSNSSATQPVIGAPNASDITIAGAASGSKPTIRIVIGGRVLVEGVDYKVEYRDADRVGTATAVITGLGPNKWVREVKFEVLPASTKLTKASLGTKKTTVKWKRQANQTDGYQVRYSAKQSMRGAKTVTVKGAKRTSAKLPAVKLGKRLYAQVRTYKRAADGRTYYSAWSPALCISNPPATAVSKAKGAKRSLTVKWKKQPKKWTSGYEVRYSLKKSMKGAKTVLVPGAAKSSAKIAGLKGGKRYYVQVRTYKKMGKKTYYSPWSTAKSAKVKK